MRRIKPRAKWSSNNYPTGQTQQKLSYQDWKIVVDGIITLILIVNPIFKEKKKMSTKMPMSLMMNMRMKSMLTLTNTITSSMIIKITWINAIMFKEICDMLCSNIIFPDVSCYDNHIPPKIIGLLTFCCHQFWCRNHKTDITSNGQPHRK